VQDQVNMAGEIGHPSQVASIFAGYAMRREIWRCPDGRRHPSDLPIPDAFHRLLPLVGLIGNSICPNLSSGCVEAVRNTRCLSNPIRYTASFCRPAFGAVNSGSYPYFP